MVEKTLQACSAAPENRNIPSDSRRMFIAVFFGNDCKGNHFRPNGTFFPQRRVALSRKMRFYRRIMLIFTIGKQQPYGLQRYHPSERSRRDDQQLSCRSGAAPGPEPV